MLVAKPRLLFRYYSSWIVLSRVLILFCIRALYCRFIYDLSLYKRITDVFKTLSRVECSSENKIVYKFFRVVVSN